MEHTVVITGASRGIGEATALHLDKHGFRVFAGVRSKEDSERLRQQGSNRLTPVLLELTDPQSIASAVNEVSRSAPHQALAVVNNAAISSPGPLEFTPLDEFRSQLEVNLVGVLAITQAFLPLLRQAEDRRIINVSSINGLVAWRYIGPYIASKHGLEGLSDTLRMELSRWNIMVCVIQPGAFDTQMFETSRKRGRDIAQRYPEEARQLYPGVVGAITERQGKPPKHAPPPDRVSRVIERALTSRRPKTRYLVGLDARVAALLKTILPDRAMDWLIARVH